MASMVSRLLDAADLLIENGGDSSAFRRRAVSTAYYAAFHALVKMCADRFLQPISNTSSEYERVYRVLDHGPLKSAFQVKDSTLQKNTNFRTIGDLLVRLQSERLRADYLPPIKQAFPRGKAEELVKQARQAVSLIELLNEQDRLTRATYLLFKNR